MKIQAPRDAVTKMLTGIRGFDEITDGGLPRGRTTLVMGGAGCGKTVFALQTLVNGVRAKEAGIFVAFEESVGQIVANAGTFGWDLAQVVAAAGAQDDRQPQRHPASALGVGG